MARRPDSNASRRSKAPDVHLRLGRRQHRLLRPGRPLRRQRPRLLPSRRTDVVRRLAPGERAPVRLGCPSLVRAERRPGRLLRRGERRAGRARPRPGPGPPRELRGRQRLRRRRRPDLHPRQAACRLERPRLRAVRHRDAPAAVRRRLVVDASTARAWTSPPGSRSRQRPPTWSPAPWSRSRPPCRAPGGDASPATRWRDGSSSSSSAAGRPGRTS